MVERKSTRVKTVAKALKRVDEDTRRQVRTDHPPHSPTRCSAALPPIHADFSPRNPHRARRSPLLVWMRSRTITPRRRVPTMIANTRWRRERVWARS